MQCHVQLYAKLMMMMMMMMMMTVMTNGNAGTNFGTFGFQKKMVGGCTPTDSGNCSQPERVAAVGMR